jgi:hypothetical protein
MKLFKFILSFLIIFAANAIFAQDDTKPKEEKVIAIEQEDGTLYGAEITKDAQVLSVTEIFNDISSYEGKSVVVKGDLSEICRSGGCWIILSDGTNNIRALTLHKFILPKEMDITGKVAVAEGVFGIKEITEEQAKHFAEEAGKDPSSISGPQKMFRIVATGIKILK